MTGTRNKQRIGVWQWPLLGALLVASFLGHDLLMAAEAIAMSADSGMAHQGTDPHPPNAEPRAWPGHGSTPDHPENCRIGQSAVARSADPFERAGQDLFAPGVGVGPVVAMTVHSGIFLWEEPHWPPGTLRALFQVYRM